MDFFEDESSGFKQFKSNIENDEDYEYVFEELQKIDNVKDFAIDIADDISYKLRKNDFLY